MQRIELSVIVALIWLCFGAMIGLVLYAVWLGFYALGALGMIILAVTLPAYVAQLR